jgi:ABC-type glycerol-3-phosphate transport system permease component
MNSVPLPSAGSIWGRKSSAVLRYILIVFGAGTMVIPFLWMISTSLKAPGSVLTLPPEIIPTSPTLESYRQVADAIPIVRMVGNSLIVTGATVVLQLTTCALAAYAFARMRWKGRDALFILYLTTLMVPGQVTITPLFILIAELGWINSYQALILPAATSAFGTFLLRQAMLSIPKEYEEAAFLDGATHWTVFRTIILPMSRASLATLAVFAAMGAWNDFLWPLIVLNDPDKMTLPVGLSLLQGRYVSDWNMIMAGAVISVVPIVIAFFAAQRAFVNGMVSSGLK